VSINNCAWLYYISTLLHFTQGVPEGYTDVLLKALIWDINVMTPSGEFPLVNDAWELKAQDEAANLVGFFPNNPVLIWAASNRTKGTPPTHTSIFLEDSGYIALRTGWGFEDTYGFFDVAPLGSGHWHQDKLNLLVDAYGRRLLYDSGGGQYNQDKWRTYAVSTISHNTVVVDGQNQNRPAPSAADPLGKGDPKTPAPLWQTSAEFDYGCGYYIDKYGPTSPAHHRREVVFWKEELQAFVVVDTITNIDGKSHTYSATWNFLSKHFYSDPKFKGVSTNDTGLPNLAIFALGTSAKVSSYLALNTSTEIRGWDIDRSPPFNIPALEVVHEITAAGNQQFVTLLLPLKAGVRHHGVSQIENVKNTQFVVHFADGHKIYIELGATIGVKVSVTK